MTRGFFTLAQGDQYIRCAYALALSLKASQKTVSNLSIGITPGTVVPEQYKHAFDQIIEIPWADQASLSEWKRENEWKVIHMTPYDHTIKLDADMLFFEDIGPWWNILDRSDAVFATQPITYREDIITSAAYRTTFVDNKLPNVYTAMFSFKKTAAVYELFEMADIIFKNWQVFYKEHLEPRSRPARVSADVVFALAAKIVNFAELNQTPTFNIPTFVHMKTLLQGWEKDVVDEDWTNIVPAYFTPNCTLKIGNHQITHPFHYHVKTFLTDEIIRYLEQKVAR